MNYHIWTISYPLLFLNLLKINYDEIDGYHYMTLLSLLAIWVPWGMDEAYLDITSGIYKPFLMHFKSDLMVCILCASTL